MPTDGELEKLATIVGQGYPDLLDITGPAYHGVPRFESEYPAE